jgi:shikimate dehydrogenase
MNGRRNRLGLVGHPVAHSLSPAMHNSVFKKLGMDYSYEAFDVRPDDVIAFLDRCKESSFLGLNVTVPYKVEVMKYIDNVSENAQLIGAVNTIKFEGTDVYGYNTDGIGCIKALSDAGVSIDEKKILILGSGGAARAIAFQCIIDGAHICISNRTRARAKGLASEIETRLGEKIRVLDYSKDALIEELDDIDILINATTVGMEHETGDEIIPWEVLPSTIAVMDIVYNPLETNLLRKARARGCKTISGVGMLVHQGAESLRIWLGIDPPVKVMEEAVLARLTKR